MLTSRFEGFPNALLEAMSYCLPCVCFDCLTGPAELIEDGINGLLVAPQLGVDGLAAGLTALMGDPAKREEMGRNASKVRETYSEERVGALWDVVLGLTKD